MSNIRLNYIRDCPFCSVACERLMSPSMPNALESFPFRCTLCAVQHARNADRAHAWGSYSPKWAMFRTQPLQLVKKVRQYTSNLYGSTPPVCIAVLSWLLSFEERETPQYASHLYCSTPPICTAVRLPFVWHGSTFGKILGQGRILVVWILAPKLPNSDLKIAVDFWGGFCSSYSFPRKKARKIPPKNPRQNSPRNSVG